MAAHQDVKMAEDTMNRKPYKISGKDKHFKGVVANSLSHLKDVACRSLQIPLTEHVTVLIEEDMTEVDNEDYFQFLPAQTKFLIIRKQEARDAGLKQYDMSALERSESQIIKAGDVVDGRLQLNATVKQRIISDPAFYVNLDDDQLESVIALDPGVASKELGKTKEEILLCQEFCEREISRRTELRDAYDLLKLYKNSKKSKKEDVTESSSKRMKQESSE